jgi:hypothetical protein
MNRVLNRRKALIRQSEDCGGEFGMKPTRFAKRLSSSVISRFAGCSASRQDQIEGHVTLVEKPAERVAALVLVHPRVTRVIVRVEKQDIRPGSVGGPKRAS